MDAATMKDDVLVTDINGVRREIKDLAAKLDIVKIGGQKGQYRARDGQNAAEVMANLTLAYRHLEDASMRLGKAIQARDGGVSVYDKETTVGA